MMNFSSRINRFVIALIGVLVLGISSVYAGSAYSDGRAYLRQGSPTGAGKVYVSTSSSTPAASSYKACNTVQTSETTTPSASAQVKGEKTKTTYHFWAVANAGYIFTGWYDSNGNLLGSGAAHVSGAVTSGQAGGSDTHAYLDYHASFIKQIQMSFITPTNGSYTIKHCGTEVSPAYSSFATEGKVVLSAMPADGYKLRGWYTTTNGGTTKKYFAFGTTCEPNFTSNVTIGADFVPDDGKANFWNKNSGKIYDNLNTANSEASSGQVIVAVNDGVLGEGTYTIKAGVTLLIPYGETYDLMTTPKVNHMASGTTSLFLFRKLTLAPGAIINCSGNICVGGQMASVNGGRASSYPMGACGMLDLSRGGTINLKSGSVLYAWGFVKGQDMEQGNNTEASGVGKIVAESGATVWEDFQVGEWRGGTASSTIYNNKSSWKFFPFQSYTIQNVEAPVEYQTGSKLKCYWAIFGNGQTFTVPFTAVGASDDKPLFVLGTGGTMKKWYDPTTDRVCYELGGGASIDAIQLSVMGESVSSSDYYLPIPANMHIALSSGCTLNLTKAMTMHAGSVVEVKSGATLNINARLHMYDQEDWGTYCMYAYYYRTYRNLTSHYNRGEGTSKATLEDATLIVDGTVNVGAQMLYATQHGANICGNGGGTLKYGSLAGNQTMTQCTNLSDANSVNIRSANLHNDNDSYTKGIASTTFKNVNGRWFTEAASKIKSNKTYDFTYIKSGDVYGTGGTNATVASCYSNDKTGLELQMKWVNVKAQGCSNWFEGLDDGHLYNYKRNKAWHQYIKTGSTTTGSGEEAVTTETYVGSDGKMLYKTDCEFVEAGTIDGNCLYPSNKALVNGSLIAVTANTSPDHGYHKSDAASTYYLCFEGCVWHPATKNAENRYTVDGKVYIWYGDKWLGVEYDSGVSLYYSLSATNVKIYYEYVNHEWVLATPVAEVTTSAGTEQVYSLATAVSKAAAGGTNVTIRLLKNLSGTISYTGANNCGLDLNGYTLSSSSSSMITMNNASGTLIIKDQSAAGTGKIQAKYSRSDDFIYGLNVTNGHIIMNSGTVHIENTHASKGAIAVHVKDGKKFTMNGGKVEAVSKAESRGVNTLETTTSIVTINGGTIESSTSSTSVGASGIYSAGGTINMNGGTLTANADTAAYAINITNAKSTLTVNGGTIQAAATRINARGIGIGTTSSIAATTTINGGTVRATSNASNAYGVYSCGNTTVNGGKIYAEAATNYAFGAYCYVRNMTINSTDTIHANATSTYAYGIYSYGSSGKVWVNSGVFDVRAVSAAYGLYAYSSTDTINGGEFLVHASGSKKNAIGIVLRNTATPKCRVNGGKFKITSATSGYAFVNTNYDNNKDKLVLAGGYYNIAPRTSADGTSYVAAGKSVKDVDRTKEQAIYDAGYVKKIAGNEYTVTWKDHAGNVIGTSQVESGKVPVWTGGEVNCSDANSTREHIGWNTAAWNGGTAYVFPTALPAIGASNVTYFAHYQAIYADVTTGGVTTRYNSAQGAWTAAMAAKQATIRLLSNLGTEASISNMTQMVFNPTNANSVIIMDLNGHSWTMGRHATAANNTSPFIHVNPTQTGCKLIITDNSASGNGYLMNSWEKTDGALTCIQVSKGELVLQKGALKVKNTASSQYSNGVYVGGANAHFTMTGGTVYSTDGYSPRGVCVGDGYADIAGGTVEANSTASEAYALLSYDTVTVSGGATLRAVGATGSTYGTYCNGAAAVLNIDSAIIISNAYQTAKGIYSLGGGQTTVDGKSSISATTTTGSSAYALYATGANTKITANDGTYTATSAGNSAYGVLAESSGAAIVNGGSFTVTATGTNARGVYAQSNGTATVKDGSFNVTSDTHADPSSFGAYAAGGTVNIEDGNFTLNVHKDLSNRNCDLARCGTGASYLNISGGTFTGDSAYHAVRSFGGETMITGNPVFTAQRGVDAGSWASDDGTAKITIDGGTFYCTDNYALYATTHTYNGKTVVGDMTVLDGKFHTKSSIQPVYSSSGTDYLKIKGGYFTSYTSSNVSNLNNFVVAPSYTTAVESTDPMYASPNDYRYRVNTKFTVTWSVGGVNTEQEYNRNETPSYGSTPVYPGTTDTYEFLGWDKAIVPVTEDVVYTAQWQKWEAEVYEGENPTPKRFEHFTDAFDAAKNLPVARIKVLSNVYYGTSLTLTPDSASGSKPLTIDLNNHVVNYTPATATYALTINKAGCKLIIDDSSVAKGGQFGHRQVANDGAAISAIYIQNGELELAGGTIIAQNNNINSDNKKSLGTRAVVGNSGTVFTMTGGKLYAKSRFDARAFNSGGTCTFNATGGTIEATTEYEDSGTKWGNNAYGVVLWNYGTFNMSGTASMSVTAATGALGVYPYGAGGTGYPEVNISGGSITCLTKSGGTARGIQTYGARATTNISGGDITANGPAGQYNIEDVTSQDDATVNITGGNFHSSTGANCVGVRVFSGTVTIGGTAFFDSRHGVVVGDWATSPTSTATAYVNGGTFDCSEYVLFAKETTNEYDSKNHYSGTVTGTMYVNGGYFKTASGNNICSTGSQTGRLILNGGYYNETSGTTQKTNITTYKGATTEVSTLSPAITVDGRTYHYQLLTDFNITWTGGDSYSKVTTLKSGTMPTNTDLDGKCFLRNDSAFYFEGWSPTPTAVTGDATYNALGVYHEAKVTVAAQDSIFDNFDEAWSYAMDQANATITLLTNLTRTTSIVYNPAPANARHTFDLNNFTIKENTTDRLLIVNKTGAQLTITDNSSEKGGCLYKKMNSSANMYTTIIYHGEMILAGGKIYVENTKDDKAWHPALAVHTSLSTDGIFTMTGGTVESQAKYLAYPIYNYATTNISGGTIIANATTQGSALGFYAVAGTATISGGTFNITASTNAIGAIATGWISGDGSNNQQGTLNITGGTFNVSCTTSGAHAIQATGTGKKIGGTYYTSHGIMNVSGGTFNVTCPPVAEATQVFAAQVNAWRQFDNALPHTMVAEARGEMNISGGTFTVDARDDGAWVANKGNVDLLRNWGTLNVSGGNFTIHQYSTPSAISVFRGKATVTGNPVFNVYAHTGNAYAVCAGYWTHENYCDKDAANNLAEAEINGGTFKIITEGQNTNVIYSLGQISTESRDAVADTITAHAGYAMNAKVTVNGGEFLGICPNASGKYPIMLNSRVDQVGTYGTAKSEIYVNGGKFKSRKGTEADNTTSGAVNCHNVVGTLLLTGGYYETNGQLSAQKADTCDIINITSADIDPEYNNGYRYKIAIHYVAQVTATGVDRKFATLKGALDYAKTLANSTVTLLNDCNFETDGIYGYALGATGKTMTIDLNNHTVNATNSVTSYDRVFGASGQITVTDNSVAKGGKLNLTKNHNGAFIGIVLNDACQLTLANGTIYVENEMASKSATAINIWGTTGIFRQTGGTLQVKATSGLAEGIHMRGTANISGGNVIATSVGNYARAFAQDADAANSKYSSLTVSGTPTITVSGAGEVSGVYSNIANTSATISGGTWNISSTSSGAHGVRLSKTSASASISGGTFNVTTTTTSAYGVYVSSSGSATVTGGTFNATATTTNAYGIYVSGGSGTVSGGTFTSRNGAGKNECFGAFATGTGTTLDITGGTFDVNSADNAGGNINVVRVQPYATVTISGGTFRSAATGGNALVSFGGVTTVSGTALFEAQTGAYVGSWYQGDGSSNVTATVNLNGGTFNVKGVAINATWGTQYKDGAYLASPFVNSIINVNGGRYKTTGSAIVSKKADGADGGTAVLNIAGGYFNEKSGTTFKDQISPYVADTSRINTLDPLFEGVYKYEVAPHYVAKVQTGSTTKYHTTAKAAFDYAKTVANPTITLLDNCTLTEANYTINPGTTWTATLDLNNFTLTPTVDATYGRAFTIGGSKTKFIVTDNSVGQGGQIYYKGNSSVTIIYFVMGANTEMELAGGTLYVENTNASTKAVGFVVDASTARFTQSGGTFTIKGAYGANGYYGGGTATFTGGTMNVDGGSHQAIGLFPQVSTSVLNVSGTFALNVTSSLADSYGVLVKNSGATGTISGGKFKFNQNTIVAAQSSGSLTINGGYFCEHPSQAGRYKSQINSYKGSKVIMDLDPTDAEYIAGYRYLVTDDPVAKVKAGSEITYYTTLPAAFNYAKTQNNAEVTLLKDVVSTSTYTWSPSSAISNTFDLNGHSLSSTTGTVLGVGTLGATLTIKDTPGEGSISYSSDEGNWSPTVHVGNGKLILQGGTISRTANSDNAIGVQVYTTGDATPEFEMTGGKIQTSGGSSSYAVLTKSTGSNYAETTISGGEVSATATGTYAFALTAAQKGRITVKGTNNPRISASDATNATQVARNEGGGATLTIEGGLFKASHNSSPFSGTVSISGGYFNEYGSTTTYKTAIEGCTSDPKHPIELTAAEQAALGEGGTDYKYKVVDAYTLSWSTDGDALTGDYTTGYTEPGTTIVAPNTPTKPGYTFSAWSPSVAATMPAANTTYTATWTEKSYTVTFYNGSHGTVKVAGSTIANGGTASVNHFTTKTLAATASTGYTFAGWTKTGSVTIGNTANASTNIKATAAGGTVTATWTANSYTITYKDQGDAAFSGVHGDGYPTSHTYGTATALVSPTKTGYTFGGWYTTSACTGDAVTSLGATAFTADITLYAKWTINNYTLTVVASPAGYGTVSGGGTYTYNTSHTITATANTGYHFVQWNDANTSTSRSVTIPASNVTYTATFAVNTNTAYTVKHYKQNVAGDGYDLAETDNLTGTTGASVTPAVKSYEGFTAPSTQTVTILADGSRVVTYNYTRNSYTLAWALDGGSISVAGTTAGFVKYGATLTAPTVTKTGYTFASWSPEVPNTMPAANSTYTATWTVNSYTIRFLNYDGEVLQSSSVNYGETPVYSGETPTKPKDATYTYTFDTWSPAITAVSKAQDYTAQFSQTANVASVTVGGATTYYTTLQDAFNYAADKTTPTIQVLSNIALAAKVTYTNTSKTTVTFDLNGHTISGAVNGLLTLTSATSTGGMFVIKSSVEGGQIRNVLSSTSARYCVLLSKGKLTLQSGTIYNENTSTGASYAVSGARQFTMTGGKLHAKAQAAAYGAYITGGTSTISGGEIKAETSGNTASAVFATGGTTTLKGTIECNISGASNVYGAMAGGANPASDKGTLYNGKLIIEGGTFNVTAGASGTAYGVYSTGGTRNIHYSTSATYAGNYADAGDAEVKGGVFTVKGNKTYGIGSKGTVTINTAKDADGNATYEAASATPKVTVTGGKFDLQGTSTKAAIVGTSAAITNTDVVIEGGWYNVATNLNKYTAPTKSCNYHVLPLAGESPYAWEVAEAYTLTWDLVGGTVTTAGTGAAVDATGTPNGVVKKGASLTAPVVTKTGYTFAAWTPAVAATMPAANTEYTATWTANTYSVRFNKNDEGATGTMSNEAFTYDVAKALTANAFTKTGYNFTGWATSAGGDVVYTDGQSVSNLSSMQGAVVDLYAKWSAATYDVTLNTNGGTINAGNVTSYTYGVGATLPTDVTKTGYTFGGWFDNSGLTGSAVTTISTTATGNKEYWAKWTANNYTITYKDQGDAAFSGVHGDGYPTSHTYGTATALVSPTKTGYTFGGWYTDSGCTGSVVTSLGATTYTANITLYAKWNINSYTLTVVASPAGYGTVSGGGTYEYNTNHTITATANTGYHFVQWNDANTNASRSVTMPASDVTYTATFAVNTNTAYTVKHYQQNLDGSYPSTPTEIDNLTGTTGAEVTPAVKSYEGFTAPSTQTVTVLADGSRVVTYNYTRNSYSLTWALAGGSIETPGTTAGSVKYGAPLTAPTVTKSGFNFTGWTPAVAATMPASDATYTATWELADVGAWLDIVDVDNSESKLIVNVNSWAANGWPYSINGVSYAKEARESDRTLKIPYTGAPGDNFVIAVQKNGGAWLSNHTYVIPQEITSNTTISADQTKNIFVKGATLTIDGTLTARNIYVAPDAKLTINEGKTLTADTIFLRTTVDRAAELLKNGSIANTTQLVYTRIVKDKDFHLFGLPLSCPVSSVHLSDGLSPAYTTGWVLRSYDEARRAESGADDNNWATLAAGGTIAGGAGYELFSASNYYREFYFPVDLKGLTNQVAVSYDLGAAGEKNAGWNAIASPFTYTYENAKVPEGLVVNWYMDGYGYYAQEIPSTIPPASVFAFQATKSGCLSFDGSSIVVNAPRRRAAADESVRIQWINLDVTDANGVGDQTSIYSHPTRYEQEYKTGIDVEKQSLTAARAILYTTHTYGDMAFAGVSDSLLEVGVPLTVYSPTAQELTISMRENDWLNRMAYVWLIDHETGAQTDLLTNDYVFEAAEGTTAGRFTIQGRFHSPQITTEVENGQSDKAGQAVKFIYQDKMYILLNGRVYDATGKLVNSDK